MRPDLHVASPRLLAAGFRHGFSRPGLNLGLPAAGADHQRLADDVGYDLDALRVCRQVHGAAVLDAPTRAECAAAEADAIVARAPGAAAGVRVADCAPILLADPRSGAVAAVHAGWRGVVAGVLRAAVVCLAPARPAELLAALGPCIGACCFEVGDEVADLLVAASSPDARVTRGAGRPHASLELALRWQLRAMGVAELDVVGGCTRCDPARWHSYRRDGAASGRAMAVIAARAPNS
ncbi:MAG: polyphenol oxidase family protein [Polyangiales bacterium]